MPLALTLDDAYRYALVGEDTVNGIAVLGAGLRAARRRDGQALVRGPRVDRARRLRGRADPHPPAEPHGRDPGRGRDVGLHRRSGARRRAASALPDAHDGPVDPQDVLAHDRDRARERPHGHPARRRLLPRRARGGLRVEGHDGARHREGRPLPREDEGRRTRRHGRPQARPPLRPRRPLLRRVVRLPAPAPRRLLARPRREQAARPGAGPLRRRPPRGVVEPAAALRVARGRRRRRLRHRDPRHGRRLRRRRGGQVAAREEPLLRRRVQGRGPARAPRQAHGRP